MDTTEEYIRMCEKAFGNEEPKGSWVRYSFRTIITEHGYWYDGNEEEGYIPLKTQDQLQDMVRNILGYTDAIGAVWKLYNAVGVNRCSPYAKLSSLEQLWLAFVMKTKYSKIWDGNNWIPETTH